MRRSIPMSMALERTALALAVLLAGSIASAEPYRLTAGDRVQLALSPSDAPVVMQVGADGSVRIRSVGGVPVAGLTLDDAEAAIETAVAEAGIFVAPDVDIAIDSYAPVMVTGDVATPGRLDYLPQLTVEVAVGLSGGISETRGTNRLELMRARAEIEGGLLGLRREMASTAARIARLEAELDDAAQQVVAGPELRRVVPALDTAALEAALADQQAILENARARSAELVAGWDEEIAALTRQKTLLEERMALQDRIAEAQRAELEAARSLAERGLATTSALNTAERTVSDAQSRTFELQAALAGIERGISEARRGRDGFLRNRREELLVELRAARDQLAALRIRYGTAETQSALLSDGNLSALIDDGLFEVDYAVIDGRSGEIRADADAATPLRPGDAVRVEVTRLANEG